MWHCTARKKKKERKGPGEGCLAGISLVYILIKNRLRGIVRKLRLIHSRQVFSNTACRVLINFFIGVPFYTFTRGEGREGGFEVIGRECIISLPLMESGEI